MAGNSPPPHPPPPPPPPAAVSTTPDPIQYWCYQCNKRVPVETVPDNPNNNIICFECKSGFVESISVSVTSDADTPAIGNEFVQILRMIAQAAREDDEPPLPPPSDHWNDDNDNDYLRIELDRWDGGNDVGTDEDEQEERDQVRARWYYGDMIDDDNEIENQNGEQIENRTVEDDDDDVSRERRDVIRLNRRQIEIQIGEEEDDDEHDHDDVRRERRDVLRLNRNEQIEDRIGGEEEEDERDGADVSRERRDVLRLNRNEQIEDRIGRGEEEDERDGADVRRERRDVLRLHRLRLHQLASRAASRRNRILDWAVMIMGLEDQSIEFRLRVNDNNAAGWDEDAYVGNPGDYVDAAGYEALLETLAESDITGRRGAPPAAKSAVENLHTVEVNSTCNEICEICAVCKDAVFNNEGKVVNKLECGHMYHGECIVPWLSLRNTCPVCRYELPTDDPEYEEERKMRLVTMAAAAGTDHCGCSSSSGAGE